MNEIFFLGPVREIIETVLFTGQITGEIPTSIMLVGPSGSAKSKLLSSYREPQIHSTDSITSMGLWDIASNDPKNEKKFILIPDMNPTLSRRSSTTQATIANLLSVTSDGMVRVDDGRREKKCEHVPMGLITACTPEIYEKHARQWFALGLRRRIIPIFYGYTYATQNELQTLARGGKIHSAPAQRIRLNFSSGMQKPVIGDNEGLIIEKHSIKFATNLGKLSFIDSSVRKWQVRDVIPVSPHVTLRTLAMAHALHRNSAKVGVEDMSFLMQFIEFTDPEKPRLI